MGNEVIRARLRAGLRNAMRARDRVAASALRSALAALDNAGAGHAGQARRLRREADVLTSVLDPAAER